MDAFFTSSGLLALTTLTVLEIVLGVDNVIFIAILSSKLPSSQQGRARRIGLLAAMGMRILLLLFIFWIIKLTAPLFYILGRPISGRDLILMGGGLFLLAKATIEIHERLEGEEGRKSDRVQPRFAAVIVQIMLLDIVFSLDSVITAVGMADQISIMVAAVILAVGGNALIRTAMDAARPGFFTLVRAGIANEGEAERLARGTAGEAKPRNAKAVPLSWPDQAAGA